MSFNETLAAVCTVQPDMSRALTDLHPQAARVFEDDQDEQQEPELTRAEQFNIYCELPAAYRYLAWEAIGAVYDHASGEDGLMTRGTARLASSSAAGISIMARYLSILPYAYDAHRHKFPNIPQHRQEQLDDLKSIALRSERTIEAIAAEPIQVSSRIERDYSLRGRLEKTPREQLNNLRAEYILADSGEGLEMRLRADLSIVSSCLREAYKREKPNGRDLSIRHGCKALRINESDTSVFSTYWGVFVEIASTDPRFFEADLERIEKMHEDWAMTI